MSVQINRRSFLGASLTAGATVSTMSALFTILKGPDAATVVYDILRDHLEISADHLPVIQAFTTSLQTSSCHHQAPSDFATKLNDSCSQQKLGAYVVREFIVSTNYLEVYARRSTTLTLLSRGSDGCRLG